MITTQYALEKDLQAAREKLEELEAEANFRANLTEDQILAVEIHDRFCKLDHGVDCGWEAERRNWEGHTHRFYLAKAQKMLAITNREGVNKIFDLALGW